MKNYIRNTDAKFFLNALLIFIHFKCMIISSNVKIICYIEINLIILQIIQY